MGHELARATIGRSLGRPRNDDAPAVDAGLLSVLNFDSLIVPTFVSQSPMIELRLSR